MASFVGLAAALASGISCLSDRVCFFLQKNVGGAVCFRRRWHIWMLPKIGVPQNGWFISWKTLLKLMIWGYHFFGKHPYESYVNNFVGLVDFLDMAGQVWSSPSFDMDFGALHRCNCLYRNLTGYLQLCHLSICGSCLHNSGVSAVPVKSFQN